MKPTQLSVFATQGPKRQITKFMGLRFSRNYQGFWVMNFLPKHFLGGGRPFPGWSLEAQGDSWIKWLPSHLYPFSATLISGLCSLVLSPHHSDHIMLPLFCVQS